MFFFFSNSVDLHPRLHRRKHTQNPTRKTTTRQVFPLTLHVLTSVACAERSRCAAPDTYRSFLEHRHTRPEPCTRESKDQMGWPTDTSKCLTDERWMSTCQSQLLPGAISNIFPHFLAILCVNTLTTLDVCLAKGVLRCTP